MQQPLTLDIDALIKFTTTWYAHRDPNENIDIIDHILLYIMHHFILYNAAQVVIELQIEHTHINQSTIRFVHKTTSGGFVIAAIAPAQMNADDSRRINTAAILNTAAANATIKLYAALHQIADVVRADAVISVTKK